jgi:hypothetical protein
MEPSGAGGTCPRGSRRHLPRRQQMDWVDRLAAELSLDHLSPHEKEHLLTASREVAHRVERKATPLAMYVLGLSVGSQLADRKRDDSIEDAIHALLLRLPPVNES